MQGMLFLIAAFGLASSAVFQTPVKRIEGPGGKLKKEGRWREYLELQKAMSLRRSGSNETHSVYVTDLSDMIYTA
ncbi:hypothetical protein AAVH_22455 [Aphelenchoides avenae]|nr:hypothetical protein AAVH_22455 [Aphelenchus avenae]